MRGGIGMLAACGGPAQTGPGMSMNPGKMERRMASIPTECADLVSPVSADADSIERGQVVY